MKFQLFRRNRKSEPFSDRMIRYAELVIKSIALLLAPTPFAALACFVWYRYVHQHNLAYPEKMESITMTGWIPVIGLLYGLLAAAVVNTVWSEYKEIRRSVKEYNIDKFMDLRDEDNSNLIEVLLFVVSLFLLASFMRLGYPSVTDALTMIGSVSYLLALIFVVVKEIDDPCGGLWYIKSIPEEWLKIDPKVWRKKRHERERAKYDEHFRAVITLEVSDTSPPKVVSVKT